jgi:hypothetical protein
VSKVVHADPPHASLGAQSIKVPVEVAWLNGRTDLGGEQQPVLRPPIAGSFALLRTNPVADALVQSTSLANAEQSAVAVLGFTELDHERAKAAAIVRGGKVTNTEPVRSAAAWTAAAARRGVAYTTFRRIAEAIGYRDVPALRLALIQSDPARFADPLWRVTSQRALCRVPADA